jgi:hypothetical protein
MVSTNSYWAIFIFWTKIGHEGRFNTSQLQYILLNLKENIEIGLQVALVTILVVGLVVIIFSEPKPAVLIQERTMTVTTTKIYYDCEPYARIQYIFDLVYFGFDELVYFRSNSLLTRAINLINIYIDEAQHSNKTFTQEYINALINLQGVLDAYQRGDTRTAYKYYAVAYSEFHKLGIISGCYVQQNKG